jgi:hypothetical protein
MKIQKIQNNKKILIATTCLIVIALASGLYFFKDKFVANSTDPIDNSVNYDSPSLSETKAGHSIKHNSLGEGDPKTPSSDTPPAPIPQKDGKSIVGVTITAVNQDGTTLHIRSIINMVSNSGQCAITLTQGAKKITKTVDVQPASSTSTCKGFDIPTSEIGTGEWNIDLHFENETTQGDASKKVTLT